MIASLFWILDVAGAALFASGVAQAIAGLAAGDSVRLASAALVLAGAALRFACRVAAQDMALRAAQTSAGQLRATLYARLFLGTAVGSGAAATMMIEHVAAIEARAARFDPLRVAAVVAPLLVAVLVGMASWVVALILVATLVPFALGMMLAGTAARQASDRQLAAITALSDLYADRLRNLPIIRHFGAGERIARQAAGAADEVARRTLAVLRAAFLSSAVLEFFAALSVALVAVYCGFSLLGLLPFPAPEALNLRAAFFALAMAPEFYVPMRRLAAAYHERQLGDAAERAIDTIPPVRPAPAPGPQTLLTDAVIDWPGRRIGPISLAIGDRGLVAVTGATGSGKTSVLGLIAGQLTPTSGRIETRDPATIAWAVQAPLLLPGTLGDNLRLGRPDATAGAVVAAIEAVGLAPLVANRPNGLDTPIDHHAAWLSGGERRRVGLARALIADRPLLLCDEPTADLDDDSARAIVALLRDEARRRAIVVATHDARLIAVADIVVTL